MMRNKFILGMALLLSAFSSAQVGINTVSPNGATILDISSNEKGILIPRLTDSERNTKLADNDLATVPPVGQPNPSLSAGTLIFNTSANRFEFWDGTLWRQLFVATSSAAGNDGVVRIDGGLNGLKPSISLSPSGNSYGTPVLVEYTTPLTFAASPITSWPETTVPFPGLTSNIYIGTGGTQRWKENLIPGQVHIWRVMATVTANASSSGSVRATFKNPLSGFEVNSIALIPSGSSTSKVITFYFYTVADQFSIPAGTGYQMTLEADLTCTAVIDSVTRISLFKD